MVVGVEGTASAVDVVSSLFASPDDSPAPLLPPEFVLYRFRLVRLLPSPELLLVFFDEEDDDLAPSIGDDDADDDEGVSCDFVS